MGAHGTDRKAHSMGIGQRAHDRKAVPLQAAQGAIGHMGSSDVHQNVKGPFQAPWIIWVTRLISPRLR